MDGRSRRDRGFTLIELMVVLAVLGILTAIALALYTEATASARVAKAAADVRTVAGAVAAYAAHMGAPPAALGALTAVAVNVNGISAGPFMAAIPAPPNASWTYSYATDPAGGYTVSATGDNTTLVAP